MLKTLIKNWLGNHPNLYVGRLSKKNLFRSFSRSKDSNDNFSNEDLVNNILNAKGEASANILSEQLLGKIEKLNQNELLDFFNYLADHHDIDGEFLLEEIHKFNHKTSPENLSSVIKNSEPKRLEILSKLNLSYRGTNRLVSLREKLLLL